MNQTDKMACYQNGADPSSTALSATPSFISALHEIKSLRADLETLRRQQQEALRRNPESSPDISDAKKQESDDGAESTERRRSTFRLLKIMLLVAPLLIVGGLHFWNYLNSYEWIDDAQIDGHLNPRQGGGRGHGRLPRVEPDRRLDRHAGAQPVMRIFAGVEPDSHQCLLRTWSRTPSCCRSADGYRACSVASAST